MTSLYSEPVLLLDSKSLLQLSFLESATTEARLHDLLETSSSFGAKFLHPAGLHELLLGFTFALF